MPDAVAPGVYVEEAPAGARVIAGVPTSTAAFLGATQAGPESGVGRADSRVSAR